VLWATLGAPVWADPAGWQWSLEVRQSLPSAGEALPVHVSGDTIERSGEDKVIVSGDAELRRLGLVIRADQIRHDTATQQMEAVGEVRVIDGDNRYRGPQLNVNLETQVGAFESPLFELGSGARGDAKELRFQGPKQSEAVGVRYSTCPRPDDKDWRPDWVLNASSVAFDREQQLGVASGAVLRFQDVPILASPWLQFRLNDERLSGWLTPTLNVSDVSGVEVTTPYYWNIAPNQDATLYPNYLSKRGLNLGLEFRYLRPSASGEWRLDRMPDDQLRQANRTAFSWQHRHDLSWGSAPWRISLDVNRVSDDNYWRDFPTAINALSTRQLPTNIVAQTGGRDWTLKLATYQWQTLQEPNFLSPAYDRVPQAQWSWRAAPSQDWRWQLSSEMTRFEVERSDAENGWRWLGEASVARRFATPLGYVAPALRMQGRHYALDEVTGRAGQWGDTTSASVWVPTASVDSGLVFERDLADGGLQTLEPRLLYAFTPRVLQSGLPIYDAALKDFNFSSIFSPYEYSGSDRVADNQSLTVGLTSRWLRSTGREWLSLSAAQKIRQKEMVVTLNDGEAAAEGLSDWLLGGTWRYNQAWQAAAFAQYDDTEQVLRRSTVSLGYRAGPAKHTRLAYTFQRDNSELLDVTWQWPLSGLLGGAVEPGAPMWYSVGRSNYSLKDKQMVNLLIGAEYDAGCWLGRVAIERVQDSATTSTNRLFFQLQLSGFGSLGSGAIATLRDSIPDYSVLRQQIVTPNRFQNYE
jgi:LPS-assembly protein